MFAKGQTQQTAYPDVSFCVEASFESLMLKAVFAW